MASIGFMGRLSRPKTQARTHSTALVASAPLALEAMPEEPPVPLQILAHAIHRAAADLHQLEEIRLRLEGLRDPIAAEFENRVADNNRVAQLTSELASARERLAETEAALQRAYDRNRSLEQQTIAQAGEMDRLRVALSAAHEAQERLRPEHQEACEQLEEQRAHIIAFSGEVFDLKTDKEYLTRQLEVAEAERSSAESQLAGAREAANGAEARAQSLQRRLEKSAEDLAALERLVGELKITTVGEQGRAAEMAAQLAAARAESRLASEAMNQALEASRAESDDLRARLEESLARAKGLQALHTELSATQASLLEEKARLQRDLATAQAENRQTGQRIEVLDGLASDARRRLADAETARAEAAGRCEDLQLALAQCEASLKRAESTAERKGDELADSFRTCEEEQTRLRGEIDSLKSDLSQTRAELRMMRTSFAARS
jgi:chromosome segregation protein